MCPLFYWPLQPLFYVLTTRFGKIQRNPLWMPVSNACQHLCGILNTALTLQPDPHVWLLVI